MTGTEHRVSMDTLTIEVVQDEKGESFIHIHNRRDLNDKKGPDMLFKKCDEKAALQFLKQIALVLGVEIQKA